jgi:hypothetical protein
MLGALVKSLATSILIQMPKFRWSSVRVTQLKRAGSNAISHGYPLIDTSKTCPRAEHAGHVTTSTENKFKFES